MALCRPSPLMLILFGWSLITTTSFAHEPADLIGDYVSGLSGYHYSKLSLQSDGIFVLSVGTHQGMSHSIKGAFWVENGYLTTKYEKVIHMKNIRRPDTLEKYYLNRIDTFLPVVWGTRAYLVPKGKIPQFCSDIHTGHEPRKPPYRRHNYETHLRSGDENNDVEGKPNLPPTWLDYILDTPLTADIIEDHIAETGDIAIRNDEHLVINIGRRQGLKPGMGLIGKYQTQRGKRRGRVKLYVVETENDTSIIKTESTNRRLTRIGLGDKVSTKWDN